LISQAEDVLGTHVYPEIYLENINRHFGFQANEIIHGLCYRSGRGSDRGHALGFG
jgi:hypothetical protein